ncbi:MAG: hypothetical protein V3U54_08670 [Thermodesulfobacteriota bacterium]
MSKYGDILKRERLDTYELVTKFLSTDENGKTITNTGAYTFDGAYISKQANAEDLKEMGIIPEKAHPDDSVCSIGFCEKENKWYRWSHRARYGFGVGDEVEEGSAIDGLPVGFKAKTLEDAKKMVIAFADSVS